MGFGDTGRLGAWLALCRPTLKPSTRNHACVSSGGASNEGQTSRATFSILRTWPLTWCFFVAGPGFGPGPLGYEAGNTRPSRVDRLSHPVSPRVPIRSDPTRPGRIRPSWSHVRSQVAALHGGGGDGQDFDDPLWTVCQPHGGLEINRERMAYRGSESDGLAEQQDDAAPGLQFGVEDEQPVDATARAVDLHRAVVLQRKAVFFDAAQRGS